MGLSIAILAAGKGTRMRSTRPKVLHTISGKPMIWHILKAATALSDDVTLVVGHGAPLVQEAVGEFQVHILHQDLQRYPGTGGALRGIEPRYDRLLILNGDMPLVEAEDIAPFAQVEGDIVLGVIELEDPRGYGRVVIADGQVERIVEERDASPKERSIKLVNAGVYCIRRELLREFLPRLSNDNAQGEYYLTDIIQLARAAGYSITPLFLPADHFYGVNSKADLARAEEIMQDRIKRRWMEAGVILRLPKTIYIEVEVTFEGECEVESGCVLKGKSHIVSSQIKANSIIEDATLIHSSVGPLARIRPGSRIEKSQIGNFVEVKKSRLDGVKAGHLSYLGDATIASGTNIGAGTITCNYDGKKKYPTTIGKNVFVGSGTKFIAPVTVADDVIIAAGTTLTRDLPRGVLAIARPPLKLVEGFYYKFFGKRDDA
ncbi:MAG: UDP-N-acetylglucosamine diphosphorylase/glucosamine-1-phosphate N-acetyltransferase [Nitratiruptor sp.]|nr:UDP-N-acetylglucosamine diphosphorylase/glucosamine-1-phosphate N-acetyltransferase [Nitratiruptor sp.]NPA83896.1 bifunctional UDP-N-acetylglucosamine diphosphorylase/glucosamine-1-phosphate N-acetyltransferase GlmU [Campylobacterota bacterium]